MKFLPAVSALLWSATQVSAAPAPAPVEVAPRAGPTVYLCGDSTMALRGANDGSTDGWGPYLSKYLNVPVVNSAIGGRSARSYWNEGRFQAVANSVKAGDIVVIEFGHNDGGSPNKNDNGRSDCPGQGTETCISDKTGEVVYTFVFYVVQASKLMLAKGATVILSSQTPNNQWEGGVYGDGAPRFVGYQQVATKALASSSVTFVDHFQAVSKMYRKLGNSAVNAFYPKDHTHTSPNGADYSAKAFVQAIYQKMNGSTSLAPYVKTPVSIVY
ncbi:SGNH hydrolase-type esterase domain-containing protein [Microdochium trichocladiopsis]|uniref:SGNH hydrolase-type esterase domain-containing protein n=1 Tax=Microdochium trichocladiopsis TaxID=1682393 RepID=A0A9P9BX95_9PEZI|nr:SGNH hydrolase-type esterase domain-containing protein [Microdochium trichocladiopsis]KAH7041607.1 SGNH hydrolase-type esterase domain-containing protein [Microdochium trichocladiopsis]